MSSEDTAHVSGDASLTASFKDQREALNDDSWEQDPPEHEGRRGNMDPEAGYVAPEDTLEMLRDAYIEGFDSENLSTTERTKVTAQAALQPFSYDVHVKLGMELLALRRQEVNMRLDAEQFGEQLKRRAFIRDMLKRVTKEDNWVQYPAGDLERITRALDRSVSGKVEEESEEDDAAMHGKPRRKGPGGLYGKWLDQRRRKPSRRAAFGTSVARDLPLKPAPKHPPTDEDAANARSRLTSETTLRPESDRPAVITTFGMAPRLMGPISSRGPSRGGTNSRLSLAGSISGGGGDGSGGGRSGGGGGSSGGDGGDSGGDGKAPPDPGSQHPSHGLVQRRVSYAQGRLEFHGPDGRVLDGIVEGGEPFAVHFATLNDDDDDGRYDLQDAAELLGLGGGGRRSFMLGRSQSELLAAAAHHMLGSREPSRSGMPRPDWRTLLRRRRAEQEEEQAVHDPIMELQMSIRRGRSMTGPPPDLDDDDADVDGEGQDAEEGPMPEVTAPLGLLEAAVAAVAAVGDEQLRSFVTALDATAAATAAAAGAAAPDPAAVVVAAAAGSTVLQSEAAKAAETWIAEANDQLTKARDEYGSAHTAKLESIIAITDLHKQIAMLRDWVAGAEHCRLAAAAAALAAQRDRLASTVAGATHVSPAFGRLLGDCTAAVDELETMVAAVTAAEEEAAAQIEEREHRRAALRLIEDECVRLAEEMAAREETDRLVEIMKAEAEAEQRMAEAKDEDEAKQHALTAAMLMGEEEWVLEKEARLAAVRAAERDEKRLAALRQVEEEKSRVAEQSGKPYDRSLWQELVELEQAARREVEMRRTRLQEAAMELLAFEKMIRHQQSRRERDGNLTAPMTPAADAAAAAAADAAVVATEADTTFDATAEAPAEGQGPAAAVAATAADSDASTAPEPASPRALATGGAEDPEALVREAVEAVSEVFSVAANLAAGGDGGAAPASEADGMEGTPDGPDGGKLKNELTVMAEFHEQELERYSLAAKARLAAARAALEALRAFNTVRQDVNERARKEAAQLQAVAAGEEEAAAASMRVAAEEAEGAALAEGQRQRQELAEAAVPEPPAAPAVRLDPEVVEAVQGVVNREQQRLAALVSSASITRAGQTALLEVLGECEGLATLMAEMVAPPPQASDLAAASPCRAPSASGSEAAPPPKDSDVTIVSGVSSTPETVLTPPLMLRRASSAGAPAQVAMLLAGRSTDGSEPGRPRSRSASGAPPVASSSSPSALTPEHTEVHPQVQPRQSQPPRPPPQPMHLLQPALAPAQSTTGAAAGTAAAALVPVRARPGPITGPFAGAAASTAPAAFTPRPEPRSQAEPWRRDPHASSSFIPQSVHPQAFHPHGLHAHHPHGPSGRNSQAYGRGPQNPVAAATAGAAPAAPAGAAGPQLGVSSPALLLPAVSPAPSSAGGGEEQRSNLLPRSSTSPDANYLPPINGASSGSAASLSLPSPSNGLSQGHQHSPSPPPSESAPSPAGSSDSPALPSYFSHQLQLPQQPGPSPRQVPSPGQAGTAHPSSHVQPHYHPIPQQQQQQQQQRMPQHFRSPLASSSGVPSGPAQQAQSHHPQHLSQSCPGPSLAGVLRQAPGQSDTGEAPMLRTGSGGSSSAASGSGTTASGSVQLQAGIVSPGTRQAWPTNNQSVPAPLPAPIAHTYDPRRHVPGGGVGNGGRGEAPLSGGAESNSSGGGQQRPTPDAGNALRGAQLPQHPGRLSPTQQYQSHPSPQPAAGGPSDAAAPSPPAAASVFRIGDMSYSQWVAQHSDLSPKALEAARNVDDMLSRLPPELHSVLLNAAELLTAGGSGGASEGVHLQSLSGASGGTVATVDPDTPGLLPHSLAALPPVVSRYVMAQLQRLYQNINGGAGKGASSGGASSSGGAGAAAAAGTGAGPGAFNGEESARFLELLTQLVPALTQGAGFGRGKMGGGGAGGPASSIGFEAARGLPVAFGAMQGSPLRSSRKTRSMGDGEGAAFGGLQGGVPLRLRHQTLSLSAQAQGSGKAAVSGRRGKTGGGMRSGGGAMGGGGGAGGKSDPDLLRRQNESLIGMDGWMVRGVTVQASPKPGPAASHPHDGSGGGTGRSGAVPAPREAFLPPLGSKLAAVRH